MNNLTSSSPFSSPWKTGALGVAGASLFGNMFNRKDPEKEAANYLDQIPETIRPYFEKYINQGDQADSYLSGEYGRLMENPGQIYSDLGKGYKESPGYQFKLNQALNAGNNAAAAGGMAGSPMHSQEAMETANGIASQDYNDYMDHIMGLFGEGLKGKQGISERGYGASTSFAEMLSQALQNRGNLAYSGAASENQSNSDMFGNIAGLASLAAFL